MERHGGSVLRREATVNWHPRRRTLQPASSRSPRANREGRVLDERARAEVETQVAFHIGFDGKDTLIKTEGVTRYQYVRPSILRRITDFLEI